MILRFRDFQTQRLIQFTNLKIPKSPNQKLFLDVFKRHTQLFQELVSFFICLCSGNESDVHTRDTVHFIDINFREDDLLCYTHCIVTTTIERLLVYSFEVTYTRQGHRYQTIQE